MASDSSGNQWYQPVAGLNNVGSFQVSGIPWVSSSISVPENNNPVLEVSFPTVTKYISVKNTHASKSLKVGFSQNGVLGTNYFELAKGEVFDADIKVTKLFFISSTTDLSQVSVFAELTGIPANQLPNNWSGSSGVG